MSWRCAGRITFDLQSQIWRLMVVFLLVVVLLREEPDALVTRV
jgi:hypothetical protein